MSHEKNTLFNAIQEGNFDIAKNHCRKILEKYSIEEMEEFHKNNLNQSLFHLLPTGLNEETYKKFIDLFYSFFPSIDINAKDFLGNTALMNAARNDNLALARSLLLNGASTQLNCGDFSNETILFIKRCDSDSIHFQNLFREQRYVDALLYLFTHSEDIPYFINCINSLGKHFLDIFIGAPTYFGIDSKERNHSIKIFEFCKKHFTFPFRPFIRKRCVKEALRWGRLDMALRVDPNLSYEEMFSIPPETILGYIPHKILDTYKTNYSLFDFLSNVIIFGEFELLELLAKNSVVDVSVTNKDKENLFFISKHSILSKSLIKLLLSKNLNINQKRTIDNFTPLLEAIKNDNIEYAIKLIKCGADPDVKDSKGNNIFHFIAEFLDTNDLEQIKTLMELLANKNTFNITEKLNQKNDAGVTPLKKLVMSGRPIGEIQGIDDCFVQYGAKYSEEKKRKADNSPGDSEQPLKKAKFTPNNSFPISPIGIAPDDAFFGPPPITTSTPYASTPDSAQIPTSSAQNSPYCFLNKASNAGST